jgi:endoglucanase
MSTDVWKDAANVAIAAIRSTGATNPIYVPGNAWTGAWSWEQSYYGTPNAVAMLEITDPGDNLVFEVHQYLDANGSGSSEDCVSATIGSERLKVFTDWLETHGKRGFLGEIGVPRNATCYAALDDALDFVDSKPAVWVGWAYWAAGPWWGNYSYSIEPEGGADAPQMAVLSKHLPP